MAFTIYPFIVSSNTEKQNKVLMNHENIHLKQQKELLIILFYPLYFLNSFYLLIRYLSLKKCYSLNMFEVESYSYENDLSYLESRKKFTCFKNTKEIVEYKNNILKEKTNFSEKAMAIFSLSIIMFFLFIIIKELKYII